MLAESLRRSIHKAAVSGLLFGENGSDSWVKADVKNVIASHKGGGTPSKTEPQFWGGDIPWASIKDLKGDRICETVDSITVDGLEGSSSNLIRAGAVIVAMRMGVGKVAINDVDLAINQDLRALYPIPEVLPEFLLLVLKTAEFEVAGATVKGIKLKQLLDLKLSYPDLELQKKIVRFVRRLDMCIDELAALEREREDLDRHFAARLQESVLSYCLRSEGGCGGSDVRLEDVAVLINGDRGSNYPAKSKLSKAGKRPFVSAANLVRSEISSDGLLFLSEEQYEALRSGKYDAGDVLLCIRGSLGKFGVASEGGGAIASSLVILRPRDAADLEFIIAYLRSPLFSQQVKSVKNGTAQPNLSARKLSQFSLPWGDSAWREKVGRLAHVGWLVTDELKELVAGL